MKIDSCKVSASDYMRQLCGLYFAHKWIFFVLPVLLCACLSVVNVNFFLVALMLLFVVIPMVLSLLYFNYALTPEVRWSVLDKSIDIDDNGLTLHFDAESKIDHDVVIPWNDVTSLIVKKRFLLLGLKVRRYAFLAIPVDAIKKEQLTQCVALIDNHITN